MSENYEIIEVTKENETEYLQEITQLEQLVLARMEQDGKIGQLFTTGKEGIQEYIESSRNHVLIAVKNEIVSTNPQVISVSYITQGQVDFTYNDVTKYFKYGDEYQEYVKSKYSQTEYERAIMKAYSDKICAFRYARDVILQEQGVKDIAQIKESERNEELLRIIEQEYNDPQNQFHEKSEIRENLNKYMSLYMRRVKSNSNGYQEFYWTDFEYIKQNLSKGRKIKTPRETQFDSTIEAYDRILQYQKYKIHDATHCQNAKKYFGANTGNTIELDTYITHPDSREKGIARLLVFEGLRKSIEMLLKDENNEEIFLVSTLHADNLSSKYVSEFFGLKDYLFVNRRSGRDRQVHIFGMRREEVPEYMEKMEKKIAVLYKRNPRNIQITDEERRQILEEQINYEIAELQRLSGIRNIETKKKFKGYIEGKKSKVEHLQDLLSKLPAKNKVNPSGTGAGSDGDMGAPCANGNMEEPEL